MVKPRTSGGHRSRQKLTGRVCPPPSRIIDKTLDCAPARLPASASPKTLEYQGFRIPPWHGVCATLGGRLRDSRQAALLAALIDKVPAAITGSGIPTQDFSHGRMLTPSRMHRNTLRRLLMIC